MLKLKQCFKKFLHRFRKSKIKAVYDDDLAGMLESLGVLEKIEKGELICIYCNEPVSIDNIGAIFSERGKVKFVCSKSNCLTKI